MHTLHFSDDNRVRAVHIHFTLVMITEWVQCIHFTFVMIVECVHCVHFTLVMIGECVLYRCKLTCTVYMNVMSDDGRAMWAPEILYQYTDHVIIN